MKKTLKQLICTMLVLCIVAGFAPMQAQAYEKKNGYRIHTVSQDKWRTVPENQAENNDVFKIKVPSDGYITVKVNIDNVKNSRRPGRLGVYLFTTYKVNADDAEDHFIASFHEGENCVALKKGTYYFDANADFIKFKWKFHSKSHGSNYCMSKAKTVTSGKTYTECFAYGYEYAKWFKIELSKKQKIKVYTDRMECESRYGRIGGPGFTVLIVDKKGNPVKVTNVDAYTQLTNLLAKGTYYICLQRNTAEDADERYGDRLISMTVKKQ
jgi:hypothetical protein